MELQHSNRIYFDPTSHSYLLDDDRLLLGVTELIKKHNLGGVDYSGISPEVLRKVAEEGTAIHKEIQDYESGVTIFATELIDEYKKLGLKFIAAEYPVSDFDVVASAIDAVYEGSAPNKVILVDIKCTDKYHRRYLEWQLGGYKVLFERLNPGLEVEATYCLHIDKKKRKIKGFYPVECVSEEEWDALIQAEKEGIFYVDENDKPCADLVLEEDELQTYVSRAEKIAELKAAIKEIEGGLKFYDERLLAYMAEHNLEEIAAPGGVFKRKAPYMQTRVDSAKLQKSWPAVYEKCTKTVEVAASISFKPNKS